MDRSKGLSSYIKPSEAEINFPKGKNIQCFYRTDVRSDAAWRIRRTKNFTNPFRKPQ